MKNQMKSRMSHFGHAVLGTRATDFNRMKVPRSKILFAEIRPLAMRLLAMLDYHAGLPS